MPCCLLALLALLGPRIVLILIWLFNNPYFGGLASGLLVQILGIIFLPWTLLAYAFSYNVFPGTSIGGLDLIGLLLVVLGLVIDIGAYGGGFRQRNFRTA